MCVAGEQRSLYQEGALGLVPSPGLQLQFCYYVTMGVRSLLANTPKSSLGRFKKSNEKNYRQFNIIRRPKELGLETKQVEHHPLSPGHSTQPGAVKTPTPLRIRCHHVFPSPQAQNPGLSWQPLLLYELHLAAFTKVMKKLFCDCTVSGSQFKVQGIFNLQCHVEKQRKYPVSASIMKGMLLIPNKLIRQGTPKCQQGIQILGRLKG